MAQGTTIRAERSPPPKGPEFHLNTGGTYKLTSLTRHAGQIDTLKGSLIYTTPANVNNLSATDIAYISCDSSAYAGNISPSQTFTSAYARAPAPRSIVLFSLNATRCILTADGLDDIIVYSMKDSNSSAQLLNTLQNSMDIDTSTITAQDGDGGNGILGRSPTTAVAMIILYSITGIITALFLIIIVVGAIRAHRHPERYGPRNIVGRARQSRAKGIARAMLETIPIVKFGDNDAPKTTEPATTHQRDIEMASPRTVPEASTQAQQDPPAATSAVPTEQADSDETTVTAGSAPAEAIKPQVTDDPVINADNGLACSVCTDDFTKGQDVRVLPCNHKFHPECIDPWLLNVSGTCPMCRTDLRPTGTNDNANPDHNTSIPPSQSRPNSEALTAFNNPSTQQNQSRRNSRARPLHSLHHYLNRGRMEEATPQERLEALRRLRLINRSDVDHAANREDGHNSNGEASAAGGGRNRLSARLSRAFGADSSRPVSGVQSLPPPPPTVAEGRAGTDSTPGAGIAGVPSVPSVPDVTGASSASGERRN
ncbi:MAG: hypothetical protein LQ337_002115 [Flavoplaca oasis]|nr:MAG: hypothetical protein LQ337_002115 [Flavoplaca oasis]